MFLANKILYCSIKKINLSQNNLKCIEEKVKTATNLKELFDVFQFIESFNLTFKNEKLAKAYMFVFALIFIILWLIGFNFMFKMFYFDMIEYYFWFFFGFTFLGIVYGLYFFKQVSNTKQISDLISFKKVVLDNDLIFDKTEKQELLKFYENNFFIFKQGNYSREITKYTKGEYKNYFIYNYYNLHYINKDTSTSTDANGNKRSDTTYYHYDLYGIIINYNTKNFIKISTYEIAFKFRKFIPWQTASIAFNQKFKIYTDNEQAVALFLQPKVMEQIEKLSEIFPKIDVELSPQGLLALSTPDPELLNYKRQYGVDQLALFQQEITKVLDQTKLHKALEFLNFLKEDQLQT